METCVTVPYWAPLCQNLQNRVFRSQIPKSTLISDMSEINTSHSSLRSPRVSLSPPVRHTCNWTELAPRLWSHGANYDKTPQRPAMSRAKKYRATGEISKFCRAEPGSHVHVVRRKGVDWRCSCRRYPTGRRPNTGCGWLGSWPPFFPSASLQLFCRGTLWFTRDEDYVASSDFICGSR